MQVASREDFLACLDRYPDRNQLEVFAHAKGTRAVYREGQQPREMSPFEQGRTLASHAG